MDVAAERCAESGSVAYAVLHLLQTANFAIEVLAFAVFRMENVQIKDLNCQDFVHTDQSSHIGLFVRSVYPPRGLIRLRPILLRDRPFNGSVPKLPILRAVGLITPCQPSVFHVAILHKTLRLLRFW